MVSGCLSRKKCHYMLFGPKWDLNFDQKRLSIKLRNRQGGKQDFKKIGFSAKFERGLPVRHQTHFRSLEPIIDGRELRIRIVIFKFRDMGGAFKGRIMVVG